MLRRFGEPVEPGRRYTTRPGAYAIILGPRGLLATETHVPEYEIQLPGGGIDPGESPLRALHREALEETGWRVAPRRRLGAYQRYTYMPEYDLWARKLCHIYLCAAVRRHGPPREADHLPMWLDPRDAADRLTNSGDRWFLNALLAATARG
ncbi:NUDIX hydrolase [Paroceanicella profunda]|uniref:NUDIX hydrolase n=1 Tax=Paroceanicella profunda TaxID=2579971 RepID=A0A5B8G0A9_9RHOB|nr:NUDIX hydrolase [Paroceanicella profunda]QDL93474.1 NUDIX hydrolase [Paroceanicella profunda]